MCGRGLEVSRDMKFHPAYRKLKSACERQRRKGLKRLSIELTIEEAARCLTIARDAKTSRKRWLQKVVREALTNEDQE